MDGRFDKKNRPQKEREFYKPGSGPLPSRKTDHLESRSFISRTESQVSIGNSRNEKSTFDPNEKCFVNSSKLIDKEKKKTRKPDASIYVPKQRSRMDNCGSMVNLNDCDPTCPPSAFVSSSKENSKTSFMKEKCTDFTNRKYDGNHSQNKSHADMKQFSRDTRSEVGLGWKESTKENSDLRKFDGKDSRDGDRCYFQNDSSSNDDRSMPYQTEYKNSNFHNRYGNERSERGNNGDKGRSSRNLTRRNSSNSLVLPEAFNSWPPRLQRKFLESKDLKAEDVDKYFKNKNNFGGNANRDNRYSQSSTSSKNNNRSHYKSGSRAKDSIKGSRAFSKSAKGHESLGSEPPFLSQERVNEGDDELVTPNEKPWNSTEHVSVEHSDSGKSFIMVDNASDEPKSGNIVDTKSIIDDSNEKFNWAEEVEREQKIAERNNSEIDERKNNCSNIADEQKDRKKRRRREFRRKRGVSHERKQPQRNRNISEGDNHRRKDEDSFWQNSSTPRNTTESTNSDGYLSWRRNKNPSPSRTRLGIMTRNHRQENKFENSRMTVEHKARNMNRIQDLPAVPKEYHNYAADKDNVAGIIKIPPGQGIQSDVKYTPPVFPVPHFSNVSTKPIKQLFNPTNPKQPILVSGQSGRACIGAQQHPVPAHFSSSTSERTNQPFIPSYMDASVAAIVAPTYVTDQHMMSKPAWYDAYSESFRSTHNAHLLLDISRADSELQTLLLPGTVIGVWDRIMELRIFLQEALKTLLTTDLKFCEAENVEQHMWKILFYNVIELLRKCIVEDTVNSQNYKNLLFSLLEKGMEYFRSLLVLLERTYKIKIDDYVAVDTPSTKALGLGGLALISAQKIFLFLGDLARYKETTEESCSYTNARQWYVKANQLNPRNGRPYNQLAILSVYGRKKFDAVYYYMRSLMASNPFFTARDSLLALFDENRKKYEQVEKARREMKEIKKQEKAREKESVINGSMLRKEIWIRPDDGKRIQRTTSTSQECAEDSDNDELVNLPAAEINKRFLLSFLHVHGKLFSKVGMETLQEAAIEMLKEFKVLLNHSPLPISTIRLIQLLSLNMFAIDNGQLKDPQVESGYHSAVQESALVISLQMFNLIINRCIQLLKDQLQRMALHPDQIDWNYPFIVSADAQILLPAIKLWCDWLFCHSAVWNPPPSCQDYKINGCGDCWSRLAVLINLLEELNYQEILKKNGFNEPILIMSDEESECADTVKISLDEDVALRGFTPLMCNAITPAYTYEHVEMTLAQICLRIHRILFFGTIFLCGIDPPVLKLHKTETGSSEYISVVEEIITPKDQSDNENVYGSYSENEELEGSTCNDEQERHSKDGAVNLEEEESLLVRKKELERIHQKREKYIRDKKETIKKDIAAFSIEMEIKPHYLVPDTNCFIDCLLELEKIVKAVSSTQRPLYSLMVPVIVLSELEGIAKGIRKDEKVAENAKRALSFLQNRCSSYPNVKCVTTRGSILPSVRFTSEEDYSKVDKNDDKILTTCLNLCKHGNSKDDSSDKPKKIYREVVLMTEDRNLRVKALSSNMPVQTVADFIKWAGLN